MRRIRLVLALAISFLVAPLAAEAQPAGKVARLGVLLLSAGDPNLAAFRKGLQELGYIEGRNLVIEFRDAGGDPRRLGDLAVELVHHKPDVILAGVTFLSADLAGKRIQFLKEAAPAIVRVGVLLNPDHADDELRETQEAARTLGIQVQSLEIRGAADVDGAFQAAVKGRTEAIVVVSSRQTTLNRARILELARGHKLPVVGGWGQWAQGGELFSYEPDLDPIVWLAATYVDKILKGAKPADLPVE